MASLLPSYSQASRSRVVTWLRSPHLSRRIAFILVLGAALSGVATYVVLSGTMQFGADAEWVLGLLYLDLIMLLSLGVVVARRLVQIILARRKGSVGSRLHARLVGLFSILAVAPAIVVARSLTRV